MTQAEIASSVVSGLTGAGMPSESALGKARLFERAAERFHQRGLSLVGAKLFYVPGRIEFLGKHTDYAGGRSLICAVDRGFCMVATPRTDRTVRVLGETADADEAFELFPDLIPPLGHWSNYPKTVGRRVARNFPGPLLGADIAFTSDLPASSGLSSSSALIIAFFLPIAAINQLEQRPEYTQNIHSPADLAGYLGTIENGQTFGTLVGDRGVGTFGGSEDPTAIITSQPGQLSQYSFCPVRHERQIPLPGDMTFVIGVSGVIAEKTGAALQAYNNASLSAQAVLRQWQSSSGRSETSLAAAVQTAGVAAIEKALNSAGPAAAALLDRFHQFVTESTEIIPSAGDAILAGRWDELGSLVDQSQANATHLLKNQVPETVYLAKSARELDAVAASAFGAGFGGSVWALVRKERAELFLQQWRERYQAAFSESAARSAFFTARAGVPATRLD